MRYNGGKSRCGKEIAAFINELKPSYYCEPFAGAMNVIQHVKSDYAIANDIDMGLMHLFHLSLKGKLVLPDSISEDEYKRMRESGPQNTNEEKALYAFYKYGSSFGGKPWGVYARCNCERNYALESKKSIQKKVENMRANHLHTIFSGCCYTELVDLMMSVDVVYLDPPYKDTTKCGATGVFDHEKFYHLAELISKTTNVFVSEQWMPEGWIEIWSKVSPRGLGPKAVHEKLFVHKDGVYAKKHLRHTS